MHAPFNLRLLAPLVTRPAADYHARLDRARAEAATPHPEAARHMGLFGDRLTDLTTEELDELYRETFTSAEQAALADAAELFVAGSDGHRAVLALPVFEQLLPSLAAARNPFTLLFKALCCLLIAEGLGTPFTGSFVHRSSSEAE